MVVKEKAKYKETEIGIIPEDWDLVDFDNAFDFLSTATYSRSELVINGDIYYIHYGDIHTKFNHFLDFNQEELCGVDKIKAAKYSLIQDGDLVLADASEDYEGIGKGVEIKNLSGKKAIAGLHTFF
jgi:type I restriction enzyme S subunit